jgi:hypothetical protein
MTNAALRTLMPLAGWPQERASMVNITGGTDPILPTSFRIGETAAAAIGAVGLAVSDLWELRAGRGQDVAVDARQATASLRSSHYLKMDDDVVSTERNTIMGVYPAKNGRWSYLHCNFPNHRAAALSVLGVPADREAVRQAVAKWDALELAAWSARWTNGPGTRRRRPLLRCRSWRSSRSATARRSRSQMVIGRCRGSGCSI